MSIRVRRATADDLPAINDIYNHYVTHSTCTYQDAHETLEARRAWFDRHGDAYPVLVATLVDDDAAAVGWASISPYHVRSAYRFTVENSVYIHHAYHRRGIGSTLLAELLAISERLGYREMIAGIDGEQTASVALHQRFGFTHAGRIERVGWKFGRWLDVIYMQKRLNASAGSPNDAAG